MCRSYISVKWDGQLYDCDFNQQIDLPMHPLRADARAGASGASSDPGDYPAASMKGRATVFDIDCTGGWDGDPSDWWRFWLLILRSDDILDVVVSTEAHCYACTAGAGSSCQGNTS